MSIFDGRNQNMFQAMRRQSDLASFKDMDHASISRMTDAELAEWQSNHLSDSPQFILANHEWQRRLTAKQIGAMRFAAWLSILGVVIGALLGAYLTSRFNPSSPNNLQRPVHDQSAPGPGNQIKPLEQHQEPESSARPLGQKGQPSATSK